MEKLVEDFRAQSLKSADKIITQAAALPTEQEKAREEMLMELDKHLISVEDEYPPEECLLMVDGVPFFAKGDISAIKAKQKQGKTNAISIMVAAILCGKWGQLKCALENARVMVIDTEQKPADTQLVYNRTLELAGLPKKDIFTRFRTYNFRAYSREEKINAMKLAIMEFKPDIVFIDGIVDLMGNFNEVDDSKEIIEEMLRLAIKECSGVDIAIVCVLHTNKATEDHNMRGHLGTMLTQKAGTVLEVTKNKNGIFTVSNTESRNKEVPDWSFCFDNNGNIVDTTEMVKEMTKEQEMKREAEKKAKSEAKTQKLIETMKDIIRKHGGKIKHVSLRNEYMDVTGRSLSTVNSYIKKYIDANIFKEVNGFVIIADEAANDNQQNLPF